jgi:hypothetical protein
MSCRKRLWIYFSDRFERLDPELRHNLTALSIKSKNWNEEISSYWPSGMKSPGRSLFFFAEDIEKIEYEQLLIMCCAICAVPYSSIRRALFLPEACFAPCKVIFYSVKSGICVSGIRNPRSAVIRSPRLKGIRNSIQKSFNLWKNLKKNVISINSVFLILKRDL